MNTFALDKHEMKHIALFAIPHALVIWFCLIMIFTKLATPFISNFAVDSAGRVYVCENEGIRIYNDRVKIGSISVLGDTYAVQIDEHNRIGVVYTSRIEWMDSSGNIREITEDPYANTYSQLNSMKKLVTPDGDKYRMFGKHLWTIIVKNNSEIVYQQNVLSFVVKMLLQLCIISMFINGIWMIIHVKKSKTNNNDS